ncbi:hypothetical protein [Alienimonas chondri]|uniref:DUF3300 domain-containing protein n=1 Tax=Alienimonas chondri TaxID=2681879 RepID=A0ABX1VJW8_9PLAN|nr:hypothetical protein [Alienimonas chondri]NNJ28042.1 hypothetical protein [Alienimonas chondri]
MSPHLIRRLVPSLLGAGLLVVIAPTPGAAADDLNQPADAPGTITPRVARRMATQEKPVPDAALEAPSEAPEPSVRQTPIGTRISPRITRDAYRAAYYAVPFNLAEQRANPGYRHAAAMKFLTGEYPPPAPVVAPQPAFPAGGAPFYGQSPARGFPGLVLPDGFSGPPTFGPPPYAFDRVQGVVPTFVNRYQTPRVFLPRR